MKTSLILTAAAVLAFSATASAGDMPAILKNVNGKHNVAKMNEKKMQEVRGDLIIPLNLGNGNSLTITLLEPNTVANVTTVTNYPAIPAGSGGLNILDLIKIGQTTTGQPASVTTNSIGVLQNGQVLNVQSNTVYP